MSTDTRTQLRSLGDDLRQDSVPITLDEIVKSGDRLESLNLTPMPTRRRSATHGTVVRTATLVATAAAVVGLVVIADRPNPSPAPVANSVDSTVPAAEPSYATSIVGTLRVPSIGLEVEVGTGVSDAAIRRQPGHDPASAEIGKPGAARIRGHRTVFGNPFLCLDMLEAGDLIETVTEVGRLQFVVTGTEIVEIDAELPATDHAMLVLDANHPRYTAREQIRVTAELAEPPYNELTVGPRDRSCD